MPVIFIWSCTVVNLFNKKKVTMTGEISYGSTVPEALEKLANELDDKAKSIFEHYEIKDVFICKK